MTLEELRNHCREYKSVSEEFPFDETTLVFKVKGKMFALTDIEAFLSISLKCDPEDALVHREIYDSVIPGYHLSKKHWNTITVNEDVSDELILQWLGESYRLVVRNLPKKEREKLN